MSISLRKLLMAFFMFVGINTLCAQNENLDSLIVKGIDFASTQKYENAISIFDQLIKIEPKNPRGYFLKSATYFWIFSTDMHNESMGDTLYKWSEKAIEVAEERLDENEEDIDALFYLGGAYGTMGRYYGLTKSYLKAYWYGQKGKNYLEEVVEKDSTYYDAYLGLGIYHYLADVLPKFVKILSFILGVEGDRDRGIAELNLAAEKGTFTKTEALFFLGAIYTYREREYEKGIEIFNRLLEKYPGNCGALIHLGRCYSLMGQCDLALETYLKILNSKEEENRIPMASLHYQMGDVYFKMNNFYSAIGSYTIAVESDTSKVGNRRWTYPWSLYKLGLTYEMIGKRERAAYFYNQILEDENERAFNRAQRNIKNPKSEIDIAIIKIENSSDCGKHQDALESLLVLKESLINGEKAYDPINMAEINYNIGKIKYDLQSYNESIIYLKQVLTEELEDERLEAWTHYMLGNNYYAIGEVDKALDEYDRAMEADDINLLNRINKTLQNIDVKSDL